MQRSLVWICSLAIGAAAHAGVLGKFNGQGDGEQMNLGNTTRHRCAVEVETTLADGKLKVGGEVDCTLSGSGWRFPLTRTFDVVDGVVMCGGFECGVLEEKRLEVHQIQDLNTIVQSLYLAETDQGVVFKDLIEGEFLEGFHFRRLSSALMTPVP